MTIGILKKSTSVSLAIWLALPPLVRWALIAKRGSRDAVTLGDLQS